MSRGEPTEGSLSATSKPDMDLTEPDLSASRPWQMVLLGLVIAMCAAFVVVQAQLVDKRLTRVSRQWVLQEHAQTGPPDSRILPDIAIDGYKWITYARQMAASGEWRLRWTNTDNAPQGRPVRWNSGLAWLLIGLGWLQHAATGASLDASIERMAIWAGPLELIFFISLISWLTAKRMGAAAGMLIAAGMLGSALFHEGFLPAYPDHHGLIAAAALGTTLGVVFMGWGWVGSRGEAAPAMPQSLQRAQGGAWIAAAFTGLGFWVSALSQGVLIAFIAIAAVLSTAIFGPAALRLKSCVFQPATWRTWGRVSAAVALGFYLLETFPSLPRLQLEVNHPLYALSLWALGEWLAIVLPCVAARRLPEHPLPFVRNVVIWSLLGAMPALLLAIFSSKVHAALDPFQINLHKHIYEFRSFASLPGFGHDLWPSLLPVALIIGIALLLLVLNPESAAPQRGAILAVTTVGLLFVGMFFYQIRWAPNAGSVLLALIPVLWWSLVPLPVLRNRAWLRSCLLALATLALGYFYPKYRLSSILPVRDGELTVPSQEEARHLLLRDIAEWIKRRSPGRELTFLSSPSATLITTYFGQAKGIGTLYWENTAGLKAAAYMLGSLDEQESFRLIKERGVTHIILISWENFLVPYHQLIHPGCPNTKEHLKSIVGLRWLYGRQIPNWARQLPWPKTPLQEKLKMDVLLLEVLPDQRSASEPAQ